MLNFTDAVNITTQVLATFFDSDNVTTSSAGSNGVIPADDGMTALAWLKKFQLIITPILLVLGKYSASVVSRK